LRDREPATVADWLAQHLGIRVLTQDRAGGYAKAVRRGAPDAMQVTNCWHLLKNLGEAVERLLVRFQYAVRETARKMFSAFEAKDACRFHESRHSAILLPAEIHKSR
jgi:transposase